MMIRSFEIAPMDGPIKAVTGILLILPVVFVVFSVTYARPLAIPGVFLIVIFAWVWLWFRPSRFDVSFDALTIVWPTRTRRIDRMDISEVSILTRAELRERIGWGLRIGAGGLWGGFGWLYTANRGLIRMYISRIDRVVWFETAQGMPWIITPDQPEEFVRTFSM
jgi:hypothetical protein